MFQVDLNSDGDLLLYMPNHCTITVQASGAGVAFIKKVIHDHQRGLRNQPGYIGTLPTQHAVNKQFADNFLKEKAKRTAQDMAKEVEIKANKLGIDLSKMEIKL
jgi:hypothetical protein